MIAGVLLAAGAGTRFGGGKLLAPLPDGTPIGVCAARTLRAGVDRAIAVVRPEDVSLGTALASEGLEIAAFPRAAEGMGASLAFGIGKAPAARGWIVALADMPFVRRSTVVAVRRSLEAGALAVAPSFRGRRGHPVGFGAPLFGELVRLAGDEGARAILARIQRQVVLLECDDGGVLHDVDAPEDLGTE